MNFRRTISNNRQARANKVPSISYPGAYVRKGGESGLFGEILGEPRKIVELLTGPKVRWWRRWFWARRSRSLRATLRIGERSAPGYARSGIPAPSSGVPAAVLARRCSGIRHPVLPCGTGKSGPAARTRNNSKRASHPLVGRRLIQVSRLARPVSDRCARAAHQPFRPRTGPVKARLLDEAVYWDQLAVDADRRAGEPADS